MSAGAMSHSALLRGPSEVMTLDRLGASHQTRLSFMRVLLRGLRRGDWRTDRPVWQIDERGVGHAVYRIRGQGQTYSLVAFAHDLPADQRSDRVIAEAWDATFALVDGEASADDIRRLAANVPLQEAGRVSDRELVLSRANRSVRLWDYVVGCLSRGQQPALERLAEVGYLMRTTAVYGSGKFGAADFETLHGRPLLDGPFRAEMLTVWLIRTFVADLVEHMARQRGQDAATTLAPELRRALGIGNSTGLGMAPFLVNHPGLLNAWVTARETALARVRGLQHSTDETRSRFAAVVQDTVALLAGWTSEHPLQQKKLQDLQRDIALIAAHAATDPLTGPRPWDRLWAWAQSALSTEGQELIATMMIEPHGDLVDDLADTMGCQEDAAFGIDGAMPVEALRRILAERYGWALTEDYDCRDGSARFWYVSEAKLEPRLGERYEEAGAERETPLDVGRAAARLEAALASEDPGASCADFLRRAPEHRHMVRRAQRAASARYSEVAGNLIAADMLPIDLLRCKLAFFGATKFDPRSDRWVRITMYQNAPYPDELHSHPEDSWALPSARPVAAE